MILHEFPDLAWLKRQIADNFQNQLGWGNARLAQKGFPSTLLQVRAQDCERKEVVGLFSVFMNRRGATHVCKNGRDLRVGEDFWAVTFPDDAYTLTIDAPADTCNFHISAENFRQILATRTQSDGFLLENSDFLPAEGGLPFQTFPKDLVLHKILQKISFCEDSNAFDELILDVCTHVLQASSPKKRPSALRKTTQDELIRRLSLAREYMHAHYSTAISLDEIAEAACLSKFHFIRLFREVFAVTPHQYLQDLRINKAACLLESSEFTLQDIAFRVGYANASTLSKVFKAVTGRAPRN